MKRNTSEQFDDFDVLMNFKQQESSVSATNVWKNVCNSGKLECLIAQKQIRIMINFKY